MEHLTSAKSWNRIYATILDTVDVRIFPISSALLAIVLAEAVASVFRGTPWAIASLITLGVLLTFIGLMAFGWLRAIYFALQGIHSKLGGSPESSQTYGRPH